jgi:hypothetical protein
VEKVKVTATNKYGSKTTFMQAVSECADFYPIVHAGPSPENSVTIQNNSIIKTFNDFDTVNPHYCPFIKEMTEEYKHLPDNQRYFVPYFRMWNSQREDRTFKLQCDVFEGSDNCADGGDIHVEMPVTVRGLSINNLEDNMLRGAVPGKTFTLDLLLTKDADRTPTAIDEVPLIFYVENKGEKTEAGRIHLSVAPKDVFSEEEIQATRKYLSGKPLPHTEGHDCMTALRVGLEKLLGVSLKGAMQKYGFNIYNLQNYLKKKNYLKEVITINVQGGKIRSTDIPLSQFQKLIHCNMGYHIFGLGISGIHTETLIINYSDPVTPVFSMFDQFGCVRQHRFSEKSSKFFDNVPLKDINDGIFSEILNWDSYATENNCLYEYKMLILKVCRSLSVLPKQKTHRADLTNC